MNVCLEGRHFETWDNIVHWCLSDLRKDCFKTRLCILCLGAAVYNLWKQRNAILHGSTVYTEEDLLSMIIWEVRARILVKGNFKKSRENCKLA